MSHVNATILILLISIIVGSFMAYAGYNYGSSVDDQVIDDLSQIAADTKSTVEDLEAENSELVKEINETQRALVDQGEFFDVYSNVASLPEGFARYISDSGVTFVYPQFVNLEDFVDRPENEEAANDPVLAPVTVQEIDNDDGTTTFRVGATYENQPYYHTFNLTPIGDEVEPLPYVISLMEERWSNFEECTIEVDENSAHISKIDVISSDPDGIVLTAQELIEYAAGGDLDIDHDHDDGDVDHIHDGDADHTHEGQDVEQDVNSSTCPKFSSTTAYIVEPESNSLLFGDFGQDTFMSSTELRIFRESITFLP